MAAEYDPQEWYRSRAVAGTLRPYASLSVNTTSTRHASGMEELMPSPPPAYSPPAARSSFQNIYASSNSNGTIASSGQFASFAFQPDSTASTWNTDAGPSSSRFVTLQHVRPGSGRSAQVSATEQDTAPMTYFPPPPQSNRRRSPSRSGRFALSMLTSRSKMSERSTSREPEADQQNQTSKGQRTSMQASRNVIFGSRLTLPSEEQQVKSISRAHPPPARRSTSAGAIGTSGSHARHTLDLDSLAGDAGSALPPPPPRSLSSSRATDRTCVPVGNNHLVGSAIGERRVSSSVLEPVPPTPADWRDHETANGNEGRPWMTKSYSVPLVTTSSMQDSYDPGRREQGGRSILQRRSESRAGQQKFPQHGSIEQASNNPSADKMRGDMPSNLVLDQPHAGMLSRRPAVTKSNLSSARSVPSPKDDMGNTRSLNRMSPIAARKSVPPNFGGAMPPQQLILTPPFSPGAVQQHWQQKASYPLVPSKAMPTPPLRSARAESPSLPVILSLDQQPSHAWPSPNTNGNMGVPLAELRTTSSSPATSLASSADEGAFAQACIERHRRFVDLELAAASDQDRLELFARFIVDESRVRRGRYSSAFESVEDHLLELTRDLWHSPTNTKSSPSAESDDRTDQASSTSLSPERSQNAYLGCGPNVNKDTLASLNLDVTSDTGTQLSAVVNRSNRFRPDAHWSTSFNPVMSPIPSMAVSNAPDEEGSRGRSASRWWESSAGGSVGGAQRIQRSKRESKYMSLLAETREDPQSASIAGNMDAAFPDVDNQRAVYGPSVYPPEKRGWHEADVSQSPVRTTTSPHGPGDNNYLGADNFGTRQGYRALSDCSITTPRRKRFDVSRLVTLPPPYPRHHPAVNNNHPDLQPIRNHLRMLSDFTDSIELKTRFRSSREKLESITDLRQGKQQLRRAIQERVDSGSMSFTEAAGLEAAFDAQESKHSKDRAQEDFDAFQKQVASPLHALFSERITKASASIEQLRRGLFRDAQQQDPNQAQEEGDEQPELLEKLTLLKWLFEAREQLHRELLELELLRNDRYKIVVVVPYAMTGNEDKIREVEEFFGKDGQDRKLSFGKTTLRRMEKFLEVIEANIARGVEVQLGAFWDIAPGLLAVVQKIPANLADFEVLIPDQEYGDSPSYRDFPLQYLYTLLVHAGESAYQFIESQTNLLCLLHEVKTGALAAGCRLTEVQRLVAGEDKHVVEHETRQLKEAEDAVLTAELKEKVALVEEQWREALGSALEGCRLRVERFLRETGGWDDALVE